MSKESNKYSNSLFRSSTFKHYRILRGLSQKELGNEADIPFYTIGSFEQGLTTPNEEQLNKLASVLDCSPDDFSKEIPKEDYALTCVPKFNRYALRYYRLSANLSQKSLSTCSGLSATLISSFEGGTDMPNNSHLQLLSKVLNCTVSDLVGNSITKEDVDSLEVREGIGVIFNAASLKTRRASAKITQFKMAEMLETSRKFVAALEAGKYYPNRVHLQKMADILCCSIYELLEDIPKEQIPEKVLSITRKIEWPFSRKVDIKKRSSNNAAHFNRSSLKRYRAAAGLSQSDLANALGLSAAVISHYETGAGEPSLDRAKKIANILKCPVKKLYSTQASLKDKPSDQNPVFNGLALKYYRIAAGVTRNALASKIGVAAGSIYQYERGIFAPSTPHIKLIANSLGCSVENLFESLTSNDIKILKNTQKDLPAFNPIALKYYRIVAGITQAELADSNQMPYNFIQRLETGKRNPTLQEVQNLATILGCSKVNLAEKKTESDVQELLKGKALNNPFNKETLKCYRATLGLTQQALADKAGISRTAISSYEIGTVVPNGLFIKRISDALGCSLDDLLREVDPQIKKTLKNSIPPKPQVKFNKYAFVFYWEKIKISRALLAETAKISSNYISDFKNGLRLPTQKQLQKIALALGCTIDNLAEDITSEDIEKQRNNRYLLPFTGGAMRYYRKSAGVSQQVVADELGLSNTSVAKMENGTYRPDDTQIRKIANFLKCSVENLSEDICYEKDVRNPSAKRKFTSKQRIAINGSTLKHYREKAHITKSKIIFDVGISQSLLYKLENKQGRYPADAIQAIADYLGLTISDLQKEIEDNIPKDEISSNLDCTLSLFGPEIKSRRQKMLLTQEELANQCGLSENDICSIENRTWIPSKIYIRRLADVLGYSEEDLMRLANVHVKKN